MSNNQPHGAERHAPTTVALVDDEPLIRAALGQALRSAGLELVAEAASGEDAIRAVLTERELEIFTLLASGANNQQIARRLHLSTHTISNHIKASSPNSTLKTASKQQSKPSAPASPDPSPDQARTSVRQHPSIPASQRPRSPAKQHT
jgi:CheY-like chemotaxis protein